MWWFLRLGSFALVVLTARFWWSVLRGVPMDLWGRHWGRLALEAGLALTLLMLLAQAAPFGWRQDNPPVVAIPAWDSQRTRELFARACADCHSNETRWPWYTNIAPGSWLVANDVYGGRDELNLSEWSGGPRDARRAREAVDAARDGSMPPMQFKLIHPEARLTEAERAALADGLARSLGN